MAHQYFIPDLSGIEPGDTLEMTGDEARHAASVSRLRVDEQVALCDGRGKRVTGQARDVSKDVIHFTVVDVEILPEQQPLVSLVQALAKGDRDERAVESATELGVNNIIPWQAQRSVSQWDDAKALKGQARWEAISREASKQALRAWNPTVEPLIRNVLEITSRPDSLVIVLDPSGEESISNVVNANVKSHIVLVVGPEGGLTPKELSEFRAEGSVIVGLGRNVLRTSTAGPAVLAAINELTKRW